MNPTMIDAWHGRHYMAYDEVFDAYYCTRCDVWLESVCSDNACMTCRNRPQRPSGAPLKIVGRILEWLHGKPRTNVPHED